jgi:histidine triad (HIT) family protein
VPNCIFCKIVGGEIPCSKVYEDEHTLAFMDIGQVNLGHVLVVTKSHADNIYGLTGAQAAQVFQTAARVAKAVKASIKPDGMSIFQANEPAGMQTVFHFHIHILPRYENDGLRVAWPTLNPPRETLDELARKIKSGLD